MSFESIKLPEKETPVEKESKLKYMPGQGINFSEIYDEEELGEKTSLEKHTGLMRRAETMLEKLDITSDGRLTKSGMLKIATLILPGGTAILAGYGALKWYQQRVSDIRQK